MQHILIKIPRIFLFLFFNTCDSFKLAIVGAHGNLGRELVKQSLERQWQTLAIVRRNDPIFEPCRKGWLSVDESICIPIRNHNLEIMSDYKNKASYDAIVFALSGSPFQKDDSFQIVSDMCADLPQNCTKIDLVSAYGVGSSYKNADIGIKIMNKWYLKNTYESKYIQEQIVSSLDPKYEVRIERPRVLSFEKIPYNPISTTRQDLARTILDWIEH